MKRREFMGTALGTLVAAQADAAAPGGDREASRPPGEGETARPPIGAASGRGFQAPLRFSAEVENCEVVGAIPGDIDGAFYRVGGEFYYPPLFPDDAPLNADGYISMFRIRNGRVDYRGRWIETERLQRVREAGRQLYGYYRNPFTDDPAVRDPARPNRRTVANTAPLVHAGKLFALKEDGLPHEIDPNSLATIGPWDFAGKWAGQTFSAHPKLDPVSGELIAYGNEADGLASDALWIYRIGRDGAVRREVRTRVPYVSVMHDMAITQKYLVFPFAGYVTGLDRLESGRVHWGWDKSKPSYIGVLPRDGEAADMRWFKGPLRCMMHTFNAHDEGDKVVLYAPFYDGNFFPFFPNVDGSPFQPELARAFVRKITLDMASSGDGWTEQVLWPTNISDLGKVDPRVLGLETRYLYTSYSDPERPFDRARSPGQSRPPVNSYARFDLQTGELQSYFAGPTHGLQEVTFVPRQGGGEGNGYLIGVASNYAEARSELVILDAQHPAEGDIARVILPFKLSSQVHGVWASADELPLR
jgi:carotenoid cleavage dioxygenase-like enzyme